MRKRSKKYRPGPVHSWLPKSHRETIQIMSHVMVDKLASGLFDELDCNTLAYELNITRRLAVISNHAPIISATDECMNAFTAIRRRHQMINVWGATGEEFQTLREYLGVLSDYFSRQPVHRVESARQWVLAVNKKMQEAGALSADVGDDMRLKNMVEVMA